MAASLFKWFIAGVLTFSVGGKVSAPVHPLYITVTEINLNGKDKTLEIACKVFTSDLETALEKLAHGKVDLSDASAAGKAAGDKWVADYVPRHLQLAVDGKAVGMVYVGREKESDGTWCYFQVTGVAGLKKLGITNTVLYDSFEQEINIMHVTVGGVKQSTRLNYPDSKTELAF